MVGDIVVRVDYEAGGLHLADSVYLRDIPKVVKEIREEGGELRSVSFLELPQA